MKKQLDNSQLTMIVLIFVALFVVILSLTLAPPAPTPPTNQPITQATAAPRPTLISATNTPMIVATYPGGAKMIINPTLDHIEYDSLGTPVQNDNGKSIIHTTPFTDAPNDIIDMP